MHTDRCHFEHSGIVTVACSYLYFLSLLAIAPDVDTELRDCRKKRNRNVRGDNIAYGEVLMITFDE